MFEIGIDVGGTKIEGVVLDRSHNEVKRIRVATEQGKGYNSIVRQITMVYQKLDSYIQGQPSSLGIGSPGVSDSKSNKMRYCNIKCINGQNFSSDLAMALKRPVRLANDANCFALAESVLGAGRGAKVMFGMVMGTGCGGGITIDHEIWAGRSGLAGEWGHATLIHDGFDCYCGRAGCVERYLSGTALEEHYEVLSGIRIDVPDIFTQSQLGNPFATQVIERFITSFGQATANLISILDPDIIVVGGGLSNLPQIYTDGIRYLRNNLMGQVLDTPIVRNKLGDSSGVIGAALFGKDKK